jgi:cytochrome c-type biogenesis protein CcmH
MSQQGRFEGKPMEVIKRALAADPNHLKALALAGTAEMRFGNKDASIRHWEKIKSLLPKDSDDFRQVEAIIVEVRTGKPPEMAADAGAPNPHPAGLPGAGAPPMAPPVMASQAPAPAQAAAGVKVTGQVSLAPEMASKLAPGDVLFILARAKSGPRMPLAVQRIAGPKVSDFPKTFELTDAMAMAPGMNLSSFPEVIIEARISKSGNAQLQPGDMSGASDAVKPGATNVKVVVSNVAKPGP